MAPISPTTAQSWMNNGVMFALSVVVVWALSMGVVVLYWWARAKFNPTPSIPDLLKCAQCAFSDEYRAPGDLMGHRLFGYLRLAIASRIPNLPISDPGRKLVFQDLLAAKFRIVSEHYSEWLKQRIPDLPSMHADVLASEQMALVGAIVEAYEAEATRIGIPQVVIDRFRFWNGPRIEHLRSEIALVCESEWIEGPTERMGYLLSVVEQIMKATIFDAEKTLTNLNGSLTGLSYRGVLIGGCPPRRGGSGSVPSLAEASGS